jgi:raffinose/stachyose/melibiose transport system substrate-binding protein
MYMMGAWEMGMATDSSLPQAFRDNLDVIQIPVVAGGRGGAADTLAWYGGNIVMSNGPNKDIALAYLKFLAQRLGDYSWENGSAFPGQKVTPRSSDSAVSAKLLQFAGSATSSSGTTVNDLGNAVFKGDCEELTRQLFSLLITPEQFCQRLDDSAQANAGK